jgi:hypothetical protein
MSRVHKINTETYMVFLLLGPLLNSVKNIIVVIFDQGVIVFSA